MEIDKSDLQTGLVVCNDCGYIWDAICTKGSENKLECPVCHNQNSRPYDLKSEENVLKQDITFKKVGDRGEMLQANRVLRLGSEIVSTMNHAYHLELEKQIYRHLSTDQLEQMGMDIAKELKRRRESS